MHRVPRRSSRHVSECVAAGRGRRQRSRSCIPRCKRSAPADSSALGCFLFVVRTRPASSPPPHVSRGRPSVFRVRAPRFTSFLPPPAAKLSRRHTVYYLSILARTHCPAIPRIRDEEGCTQLCCIIYTRRRRVRLFQRRDELRRANCGPLHGLG